MKGGFQGLKISQVSLVLIALVCTTVLVLAWTKTSLLTSFIPSQSRILQLNPEISRENNISEQTEEKQVESHGSSGKEFAVEKENVENVTPATGEEHSSGNPERTGSSELTGGKSKTNQAEIVPENSSTVESSAKPDQTNLSATTGKKETPNVSERTKSKELSGGKNNSKQAGIAPAGPVTVEPSDRKEQAGNLSVTTGKKDCNYGKGKWVLDDSRPLYSGFDCKQWLSPMWACRLTQRTDFEYEKLRWTPKDCTMEDFTGPKFLQRMKDKTLAFVGDSLGRQQFQSLMCMVTGGEQRPDVLDVGYEYGLVKAKGAVRPDGWAYRFPSTNTTILYYWSASLSDLEPINPSNPTTNVAMHLDRAPYFLRHFIHRFNVLVLNTGHHWNRGKLNANRWVMYVNGVPNTNRKIADIAGAKNFTVYSIVKWVDSQLPLYPGLKAFLRTMSPRHFFNGDWNTGGTCDSTIPQGKEVVQDESGDPVTAGAVVGTSVKLLDITALSQLRDEGHISRYSIRATPGIQDCLHWCMPGVPDTWNEILFAQI